MEYLYCVSCGRNTGHKRALGWGTLFAIPFTLGITLLLIPFYPKRCIVCGRKSSDKNSKPQYSRSYQTSEAEPKSYSASQERDTKKCPACAELIKLEATKCRFCGERFDAADVARQTTEIRNESSFENQCPDCGAGMPRDAEFCPECHVIQLNKKQKIVNTIQEEPTTTNNATTGKAWYKKWWAISIFVILSIIIIRNLIVGFHSLWEMEQKTTTIPQSAKKAADSQISDCERALREFRACEKLSGDRFVDCLANIHAPAGCGETSLEHLSNKAEPR